MTAWLGDAPDSTVLYRIDIMKGDALCLLGAMGKQTRRQPPLLGLRESRLHEFGDPLWDAMYIEYNDFLLAADGEDSLRRAAIAAIFENIAHVDTIVFRNITPALENAALQVVAEKKLQLRILNKQPVFVCDLAKLRTEQNPFLKSLSKSLQAKIRRSIRRYEERGSVSYRLVETSEEKMRAWDKLLRLHEAGWRMRGKLGVFANSRFVSFHQRLSKGAPANCHLFEVSAGHETIGVLYNFVHDGQAINYQSGFLFEDDNQLAPGFVCHALAAQYYLDQGYASYDLLAGEADYKRRLGEEVTTLTSLAIDRPTWRNKLRCAVKSLISRGGA